MFADNRKFAVRFQQAILVRQKKSVKITLDQNLKHL